MDLFKLNNNDKATAYDFYETNIVIQNRRIRNKTKRILHKLSRARLRRNKDLEFKSYGK